MTTFRRGLRQWLRDDLEKMVGFGGAARLIRREPRLLWLFALYLAATFGVTVIGFALVGRLDVFGNWAFVPAFVAAGMFGQKLYQRREAIRRYGYNTPSAH
ncbi:hypothetical protein ABZ942_18735 [Nocardia sp. NPDC046473]|uniref:hypothetical protein n=1 Tax=Nocardia sp. NPDC046473 TaxID=3155733 RepID=UPI0033F29CD2